MYVHRARQRITRIMLITLLNISAGLVVFTLMYSCTGYMIFPSFIKYKCIPEMNSHIWQLFPAGSVNMATLVRAMEHCWSLVGVPVSVKRCFIWIHGWLENTPSRKILKIFDSDINKDSHVTNPDLETRNTDEGTSTGWGVLLLLKTSFSS